MACEFCEALKKRYVIRIVGGGKKLYMRYSAKLVSELCDGKDMSAEWEVTRENFRLSFCPSCGADIKKRLRTWKAEVDG